MFEHAIQNEATDLQALIMFLAFEKKVLTMDCSAKELDVYFLEKHKEKMNEELTRFKQKMNINYKDQVYEVEGENEIVYVLARDIDQAKMIAARNGHNFKSYRICGNDELFNFGGVDREIGSIKQNKKPCILGGFHY